MEIKINYYIIAIIIGLFLLTGYLLINYILVLDKIKKQNTENIIIKNNTIKFDSLTLKQKIAQMIIVRGDEEDLEFANLNIGGIFLDRQTSEEAYENKIASYQENSKIKLFVSTDLEGSWNPFIKDFENPHNFPYFSDIKTSEEAYEIGLEQSELLKKLGFNLNFAPVAEFEDNSYGGRVFTGTTQEIKEKLASYIKGLQENVLGTCKHYPGKGMIKNTHIKPDSQNITEQDIGLFKICFENNVSAIMIGHQKATGILDSKGKPSSVSKEIIDSLKNNPQLIISDEINMWGLKFFYILGKSKLYMNLINAGENVILDFKLTSYSTYRLISKIEKDVENRKINKENIDKSVKKILISKGYKIN
ncbi:MAG: hypothetical protein KJ646_03670 [Nanoarchaeota archaeon]|nr:hypothetical protein [Nanoarchaeota archaeon]MBU4116162.1 hypothetical protein [Nanoarchaeota archaeon]